MLKKILWGMIIVTGAMLVMMILMHAIPGSPWSNYSSNVKVLANFNIDAALQTQLEQRYGLNLPLWRQFTRYMFVDVKPDGSILCGAICGNLGPSIQQHGVRVEAIIFGASSGTPFWQSRFGYSLRLVFFAVIFVLGLGIPLGAFSALRPRSRISRAISVFLAALISLPNFVLGLLAIIVFATWLHWIPVLLNWNNPWHWLVPAFVLAFMPMSEVARVTRTAMQNVIHEDYVRTAYGKGLTRRRIAIDHILRNALVPITTYLGPITMEMFVGLFVVEGLYSFPGMGREYWKAVLALDYPMILGLTFVYATGMVLINVLNQVVCERIDPRIREISQGEAP